VDILLSPRGRPIPMNHPAWFLLIEAWCFEEKKTGLTLPFLIGADARSRGVDAKPDDVRPMLDEIATFVPARGFLMVRWCPWLSEPVFGLFAGKSGPLEFQAELFGDEGSADKLLEEIARNAEILVSHQCFSKSLAGKWSAFTEKDLNFIDSILPHAG
jgi:hypothetical protein